MDLKQYDLKQLIIQWEASSANLQFRAKIEDELQLRIATNKNCSREHIFKVCRLSKGFITVLFIPTSEAYKKYGNSITVRMLLNAEEEAEIKSNYSANPPLNSYGQIKSTAIVAGNLTEVQIKQLETEGFNTSDIL